MQKLNSLLCFIDKISEWTGKIVSFLVIGSIIVVLIEVVARYFFNNPTVWGWEMSLFLFGGAVMLGGAYTLLHGSHVKMDVAYARLSVRARAILDVITFIFFLVFVVIMIWKSGYVAVKAIEFMEKTESPWGPVIWPSRIAITIGAFLLLLQGIAKFVRDILIITGREHS